MSKFEYPAILEKIDKWWSGIIGAVMVPLISFILQGWQNINIVIAIIIGVVAGVLIHYTWDNFIWSRPESPFGRENEVNRLISKIRTGQSGVVIGAFGEEKTQILQYLRDKTYLNHTERKRLIFSFIDLSTWDRQSQRSGFWRAVLEPLNEISVIKQDYEACKSQDFTRVSVENLLGAMYRNKIRLILIMDRFHEIIHFNHLSQPEFLANLRSLAPSRNPSPLCLIVTSKESLLKLHKALMLMKNVTTSPYFNFMNDDEVILGILAEGKADTFIKKYKFSETENNTIKKIAGYHPYLLKLMLNSLREAHAAREDEPLAIAKQSFICRIKELFENLSTNWSEKTCLTFVAVAQQKARELSGFEDELKELEKQGLIYKSKDGMWQVSSPAFSEILKDKQMTEICKPKQQV